MATGLHIAKQALGGLLALAALYLAYRSWDDAHFAYLRGADTAAAHAARPEDPVSLSKFLDRKMAKQQSFALSKGELQTVREAMIDAPLSRGLLRIVGLKAESDGDTTRADTAMAMSSAVSRRDALTQLWLIERSVSKDDMNGAVQHYHAAMAGHPELRPALFSILSKAIAFPEVRKALAPYIARQASWSSGLLGAAISHGKPADVALLIIPVGDMVRGEAYEAINATLISKLAEAGDFALAGQLAKAVVPELNSGALGSLAVNDATTDKRLGRLAWSLTEGGRALASPNGLGGFDIDIDPLVRGTVASRIVPVTGGRTYVLKQTLRGSSSSADLATVLNWQAFCVPSQPRTSVWQQMLPKPRRTQRYESTIDVPSACKGLELELTARGPEGQQAAHLAFEAFDLKPRAN